MLVAVFDVDGSDELVFGGLDLVGELVRGVEVSSAELRREGEDFVGSLAWLERVAVGVELSVVSTDELVTSGGTTGGLVSVVFVVLLFAGVNSQMPSATRPATTTAPIAAGTFHLPRFSSSSSAAAARGSSS